LRSELSAFLKAVRTGDEPAVTGEAGAASLEIAIRCLGDQTEEAISRKSTRRVAG
jgi:UDP-N-acetylglucosamine 3-dehydrogenase